MRIVTVEGLTHLTQLKDLEYICDLALKHLDYVKAREHNSDWPDRVIQYRRILIKRIYELEHRNLDSMDNI